MFPNVCDYEGRRRFTIGKRVRPVLPPQVCAPAPATKANGIVAVRVSCQLENGNPGAAPLTAQSRRCGALRVRSYLSRSAPSDVLFFAFANLRTGEENLSPIENIIREVKEEIAKLSQVLRLLEGTSTTGKRPAQKSTARPTRTISAAGRKRIAAAQRARWAKIRAAKKG